MKRIILIIWIVLAALTGQEAFAASLGEFNYLNDIKAYTSETDIRFSIYFKKTIKNYKGPIFYEKSIQIDFPDAYLHPAKRKFQIDSGLIEEVLAYQFAKNVVRVRFVLKHSQYDLEKNFTLETKGKGIIFSLKKLASDPLTRLMETVPMGREEAKTHVPQTTDIESGGEISEAMSSEKDSYSGATSLPDTLFESFAPADPNHDPGEGNSLADQLEFGSEGNVPDLFSAGVKIYGTLFAILAVFLIAFYFAKNYFFQGAWLLNKEKLIDVIATNPIGSKKAISVVEVAGEILVLGVSSNQISMLTRIEDAETTEKLKQYKKRFQQTTPLGGFKFPFSFKKKNDNSSSSITSFSSQLKNFASDVPPEPEFSEPERNSAADVARLIQERLGKVKRSGKVDLFVGETVDAH